MQNSSPYQAPDAELNKNMQSPDDSVTINRMPAMNGVHWFFAGFRRTFGAFLPWTGIGFINMLLMIVLTLFSLIPLIGFVIPYLFYPVLIAGFMQAAFNQDKGTLSVADLFAGFSRHTGTLFINGALYLVMMIVTFVIAGIFLVLIGAGVAGMGSFNNIQPGGIQLFVLLGVLIFLALLLPVIMAIWFSPALIILRGAEAIEAIKLSFKACMRNFMPYLMYSLVALLLLAVFGAIFYFTLGLPNFNINSGFENALSTMLKFTGISFVLAIWLAPIFFNGVYASYKEIFHNPETD